MAKRRPEDILPFHRPSKRLCGSLVHMQPGSISPAGGVNSPALVVLSGRQSKKRSYYFENRVEQTEEEEEEACLRRKITRAPLVLVERTCGCFSERCSTNNAHTCSRTRSQEECTRSDTIIPKTSDHVSYLKQHSMYVITPLFQGHLATRWRHCICSSLRSLPLPEKN